MLRSIWELKLSLLRLHEFDFTKKPAKRQCKTLCRQRYAVKKGNRQGEFGVGLWELPAAEHSVIAF